MTNLKNPHTPDGTSSDPIPIIPGFIQTRNTLESTGFYLGDQAKAFKSHVVWKRVGRGSRLVTKESAIAVDEAGKKRAAAEAHSGRATATGSNGPFLEPAILSTIVLIDFDDCWLTPCGYWKGPTTVTPNFEDLKLSFQGKAPSQTILSQDFTEAIGGARWLIDEVSFGSAPTKGFLALTKGGNNALKFRHLVFEKLEDTGGESNTTSNSDDDWTMAKWPVIYPEAAAQREKLTFTHRPVPLPAYDIDGVLIAPDQCKNALAGAIARVSFSLNHWHIEKGSKDHRPINSFVADVTSIRILVNPPSQAVTPRKRKTARYDPGDGSPTKKANII